MADRVVVMNKGIIEQAAAPITLYEAPANMFVAAFIGAPSMNFLSAHVIALGSGLGIRIASGAELPVPSQIEGRYRSAKDKPIVFGIRPEHMAGGAANGGGISQMVHTIEPLGPHTLLIGEVAGTRFTAQVDAHYPAAPDSETQLTLDMSQMHLFDSDTGARL